MEYVSQPGQMLYSLASTHPFLMCLWKFRAVGYSVLHVLQKNSLFVGICWGISSNIEPVAASVCALCCITVSWRVP